MQQEDYCLPPMNAAKSVVDIDVINTPYFNTIPPKMQGDYPGDLEMEKRLHGIIPECHDDGNGGQQIFRRNEGHISTYASTSTGNGFQSL